MRNPLPEEVYLQRTVYREPDVRGDYFRDQTAIIHSTAFRRLKKKTQVFYAPDNDHICTRIEHVLHVATISAAICRGLQLSGWQLNPDMAYAIGLGHDLGHTPFGHAGEKALDDLLGGNNAFVHEINSYRIVSKLANKGYGLNLTYGVCDGIICHNGERDEQFLFPDPVQKDLDTITNRKVSGSSYEACIVRMADKIAYLGRDLEDALMAGLIHKNDIPAHMKTRLGTNNGEIIKSLVLDLIESSKENSFIGFSNEKYIWMTELKRFNYEHIYFHKALQTYEQFCTNIIVKLFEHFSQLFDTYAFDLVAYHKLHLAIDRQFGDYLAGMKHFYEKQNEKTNQIISDFISGMTDSYCIEAARQITIPVPVIFSKSSYPNTD